MLYFLIVPFGNSSIIFRVSYDTILLMGNFRDNRGGGGKSFGRRDFGANKNFDRPRKMTKVTCSQCGKETEVPFKPTGDRPVYCRDCFAKQGGSEPRRSFDRNDSRSPFRPAENRSQTPSNNNQLNEINVKLDRLIKLLTPTEKVAKIEVVKEVKEKKKKAVKIVPETPEEN